MRFYYFLFLFALGSLTAMTQERERIVWKEGNLLSWQDFKGETPEKVRFEANTNTGMIYSWQYVSKDGENELQYEVKSNFYPALSWVREGEADDHLLAHEQLHFDISELHARKLRKMLSGYEPGKRFKKELNSLYKKAERDRVKMQEAFDRETNHSLNKVEEARWQIFVKQELEKLKKYAL